MKFKVKYKIDEYERYEYEGTVDSYVLGKLIEFYYVISIEFF